MTSSAETRDPLGTVALVAALGFMGHVTWVAWRDHYTVPFADDWRLIDEILSRPLLTTLLTSENGHRVPVTQLLFWVDHHLCGGHMHLLVLAALACTWGAFLVAGHLLRGGDSRAGWRSPLAFTGVGLFWAGGAYDLVWGANQGSQQAVLLVFVALAAMTRLARRHAEGGRTMGALGLTVAAAIGATFSQGIGVAVWPALMVTAVAARLPWRMTVILGCGALACVSLYSLGMPPGQGQGLAWLFRRAARLSDRFFPFVGAFVAIVPTLVVEALRGVPVVRESYTPFVGAAGLAASAVYVVGLVLRRRPAGRAELLALGLLAFGAVGAVVVALNRFTYGMNGAHRWVTWSAVFWLGLVLALASLLPRRVGVLGVTVLASLLLPALRVARLEHAILRVHQQLNAQTLALGLRGRQAVLDIAMAKEARHVHQLTDRLQAERRGFFAEPMASLPGARAAEHFVNAGRRCIGAVVRIEPLDPGTGPGMTRLVGFILDPNLDDRARYLIAIDRDDRIEGLGTFFPPWTGMLPTATSARQRDGQWVTYVRSPRRDSSYQIATVLADGRTICRFASVAGTGMQLTPAGQPPAPPPLRPAP